jgi:hypothetical protein
MVLDVKDSTTTGESRFLPVRKAFAAIGLGFLLGTGASPCLAGITWSARAIDPSQISAIRSDDKLLNDTLFGEPPKMLNDQLTRDRHVLIDADKNKEMVAELKAWVQKRKAEVGDTEVDLDKAWHGIHYLLTGSAESNDTLASKVIMGGQDIGPDRGYGPAQLLMPGEVKEIAKLLEQTTIETLRARYKPKEMTRARIYPEMIWERDGEDALRYVLENYKKLAAFYERAAERGQAVILAIT